MFRPATALPLLALLVTGCAPSAAPPTGQASLGQPVAYRNPTEATPPDRTRTGRYSYVANGPAAAQIDPLLAIIDVRLPQELNTVGLAADYLLKRSGYCLMEPGATEVRHLLRLSLPEVHRHLGPMTLRQALLALGGQAYELVVDPVYREVGYRVIAAKGSAS